MYAWAIELEASNQRRLFCVLADTKNEAVAKAFDDLEGNLHNDPSDDHKVKDFTVSLYISTPIPTSSGVQTPNSGASGFEEQIRGSIA